MAEQIRIRDNGKINKIKIPSDKLEVIQKILKSNVSDSVKKILSSSCLVAYAAFADLFQHTK
ncbi:MAG TPA: hypothetical protein VH415_04945 [Nitrososphaeraceae archaeon]|jgi:hypothetical protein